MEIPFIFSGSEDIDEEHYPEERRKVPPITANSHLYCHSSNLHIPSEGFYPNIDPKTQKYTFKIKHINKHI